MPAGQDLALESLHLWNPWPGRHWPFAADEEVLFVEQLEQLAAIENREIRRQKRAAVRVAQKAATERKKAGSNGQRDKAGDDDVHYDAGFQRSDLTMVITALRAGTWVAEIMALAPGCSGRAMLRAYRHLDMLRARSATAWGRLGDARGRESLLGGCSDASKLLPVVVTKIQAALYNPGWQDVSRQLIAVELERISEARAAADRVQGALRRLTAPSIEGAVLGRQLFNPTGDCLYYHPSFLPLRVGELSTVRVADLLGERRVGALPT